jgi:transcription elongation GreA/GreB family factor
VSIGTKVTLRETASGKTDVYTILGAWDSVPEEGIISYQTAIAQSIIGKPAGEKVNIPTETGEILVEIVSIEAYKS